MHANDRNGTHTPGPLEAARWAPRPVDLAREADEQRATLARAIVDADPFAVAFAQTEAARLDIAPTSEPFDPARDARNARERRNARIYNEEQTLRNMERRIAQRKARLKAARALLAMMDTDPRWTEGTTIADILNAAGIPR